MAAIFNPLRRRAQTAVDRRFHRTRYDAGRTVEGFAGRLRDQLELPTLTGELFAPSVTPESGGGASSCSESGVPAGYDGEFDPAPNNVGEFVAWIAQNLGNSGANNPGNAQDPAPPFVPFVIGCNPTAP